MIKGSTLSIQSLFSFLELWATVIAAEFHQIQIDENVRDISFRLGMPALLLWSHASERQDKIERQHDSFFLSFLHLYKVIIARYPADTTEGKAGVMKMMKRNMGTKI